MDATGRCIISFWGLQLAGASYFSGRFLACIVHDGFFLKALGLRTGALISLMWRQGLYPIGGENPWFNSPPAWRNIPIIESYPRRSLTGYALMPTISHLEWEHFFQTYENLGPSPNSPALKIAASLVRKKLRRPMTWLKRLFGVFSKKTT